MGRLFCLENVHPRFAQPRKEGGKGRETTTIAHTNLAPKNAPLALALARGVLTLCHFLGSGRRPLLAPNISEDSNEPHASRAHL